MLQMYVTTPNNNVVILNGIRDSFRCRQRKKDKKDTFKFISYRKMLRERKKHNSRVYGPFPFYTISKL
jgi:hypothetical protein